MRQFYFIIEKGVVISHQLSWSHVISLLPINNINKIKYYINILEKYNLSYRELRQRIKNNEYERLDVKTIEKIVTRDKFLLQDFIKNPILIRNSYDYVEISEKILKKIDNRRYG